MRELKPREIKARPSFRSEVSQSPGALGMSLSMKAGQIMVAADLFKKKRDHFQSHPFFTSCSYAVLKISRQFK